MAGKGSTSLKEERHFFFIGCNLSIGRRRAIDRFNDVSESETTKDDLLLDGFGTSLDIGFRNSNTSLNTY
jgi:hypothetical protein